MCLVYFNTQVHIRMCIVCCCSLSRGDRIQRSTDSDEVVAEKEAKRQLWVDQYSPQHFTELLSDDVRI